MIYCLYTHVSFFFFNHSAPTEIYPLSLHDALPILGVEAAEHPGPEVTRKLGFLEGRKLALEKRPKFLFVRIRHFLSHFALTSTPRELSFLRSMRTARKTRTLTSAGEMPTASAISW